VPGIKSSYQFQLAALLVLVACLANVFPARADDTDLFNVDSGHWMSFERYDDNVKHNRPVGNESLGEAPAKVELPELTAPSGAEAEKTGTAPPVTVVGLPEETTPAVAAPLRPLDLPILPGVNKGYGLQVTSTVDSNAQTAQIVTAKDGSADMHLQDQNWQNATDAARQHANGGDETEESNERPPLDVRMSYLPNPKMVPTNKAQHKPRLHIADLPSTPAPKPMPTEAQKAVAECTAALDAYKKKEIEAIQSDRQTLQALQSAIADLGLQKQLDFLAGAQQSPTLAAPQQQKSGAN
jgi:hypothetical protein